MDPSPHFPLTKDLVLIGGGHSHALVLRQWGMNPLPGARLTLINPGPTAPYSGMLPGFVAGHYERDALDIDLVKLARFAGARLVLGAATGIDTTQQLVHVADRPPIAYDALAIDVGITSDMPDLPGFADHAVPAKPLGQFAARWHSYRKGIAPAHVAVIGGGVAGAELIMAMAFDLRRRNRLARATLIDSARALTAIGAAAAQRLRNQLTTLGITLIEEATISSIETDHIRLSDGREILSDFTTGAAGARPYDWLAETGLALHDGYVAVSPCLQSSDRRVFATGDCAHLSFAPRPKAGVYAVRQSKVLFRNLRAFLTDDDLFAYKPQQDYLKLISLGSTSALAERFGVPISGPMMWRWKDHIDQTFMNQFSDLPMPSHAALPAEHTVDLPQEMRNGPVCGNVAAEIACDTVPAAPPPSSKRDSATPLSPAYAKTRSIAPVTQVTCTHHLHGVARDPVLTAQIAVIEALAKIQLTGASPHTATLMVILPRMSAPLQQRTLAEIRLTAQADLSNAGVTLEDTHVTVGTELTIGFTLIGEQTKDMPSQASHGARPGDLLVLTKPIGTGVLLAADLANVAKSTDVAQAYASMCRPLGPTIDLLRGATARTLVGHLGLARHLTDLCAMSRCGALLDLPKIPYLSGAQSLSARRARDRAYIHNAAHVPHLAMQEPLLCDPQTAGGLLAALPPMHSAQILETLTAAGERAAVIGEITEPPHDPRPRVRAKPI